MATRTVDPDIVRVTHKVCTTLGHRLDGVLSRTGLMERALDLPGLRVTAEQTCDYVTAVQDATGRDDLGMVVGARQTVTSWGVLGLAMLAADTVESAVDTGVRFRSLAGALIDVEASGDGGGLVLIARPFDDVRPIRRFLTEEAWSSITGLMRVALGPETSPQRVDFDFPAPEGAAAHAEFFGCPVRYDRPEPAIWFPDGVRGRPLRTSDPYCRNTTLAILERELAARRDLHGVVGQVEATVRASPPGVIELPRIAARMHMSERTLRRRLAESGTTFQTIVDRARRERARTLLAESDAPLSAIARECGLSDERSLRRAVHRWFGRPPSALRRA